jgi:hypothetical protein
MEPLRHETLKAETATLGFEDAITVATMKVMMVLLASALVTRRLTG